jgi:hypothetical protein
MNKCRLDLHRTLLATLPLLGSMAATVTAADAPAGWQKVLARKGGCAMSVPADWKVDTLLKGSAGLDDQSASAVVSLADSVSTLAEVKPVMEGNFKPTKTFEDSPQRLFYQYLVGGRTAFYVGVPVKGGICGAQISFKPGKEAIANKIAASVGAG